MKIEGENTVLIPEVKTIRELLLNGKNNGKDKNCLYLGKNNNEPLSFDRVYEFIRNLGTYLLHEGNVKSNIALLGENSTEWILSCLSIMSSGNVAIPLDRGLSDEELIEMVRKCECTTLFYSSSNQIFADKVAKELGIKTICLIEIFELEKIGNSLIEEGNKQYEEMIPQPDDLAAIIFTSGTSGDKKGVMLSHLNLASDAEHACKNVRASSTLILLPLHHSFIWRI